MPELSLLAAALVGLMGGVHCVGMCGPLVTAFALQRPGKEPRLLLHLSANLGRLVSYTLAGAVAGGLGESSLWLRQLFPVEQLLFGLAQVMLVLLGLYLAGWNRWLLHVERAGSVVWRRLQPLFTRVLPIERPGQAFLAGLLWGWLPCGLVYSVLIAALASGSPTSGALTMLAFGLGTLPNLLAMGWFANRLAAWVRRPVVRRTAGLAVLGLGLVGLARLFF
ncbi:sulfite exporter TauE/SafE family protein [Thiobacter aerophilum]|uniref:Sulfite exporter TauE/SafE family protein n=1 Tax=Thiobacter aerophilum TaxID=3121275 RepID=A0ABV0EFT7_9BURK